MPTFHAFLAEFTRGKWKACKSFLLTRENAQHSMVRQYTCIYPSGSMPSRSWGTAYSISVVLEKCWGSWITVKNCVRGMLTYLSTYLKISCPVEVQHTSSQYWREKMELSEGTGNFSCFIHMACKWSLCSFPKCFACIKISFKDSSNRWKESRGLQLTVKRGKHISYKHCAWYGYTKLHRSS